MLQQEAAYQLLVHLEFPLGKVITIKMQCFQNKFFGEMDKRKFRGLCRSRGQGAAKT
jgi:hypothetical protein